MFAPTVGRVLSSAFYAPAVPASCLVRAALNAAQQPALRRSHQRRLSSSKPSTPPSSKKSPEEIEQNATADLKGAGQKSRGSAKKVKGASTTPVGNNIPMVPATHHLLKEDVRLSAFYGLHRPISIQHPSPAVVAIEEFNSIFDPDRASDAEAMAIQETKDVLGDFLQRMHDAIDLQEERRADAAQIQQQVIHIDAVPTQESIEEWVAKLPPFSPPPAVMSHDQFASPVEAEAEAEAYSAIDFSTSINQRVPEAPLPAAKAEGAKTFRQHVARRRRGMLLISVKRQRKLKMKKHKYKKLMKRTRLERRKLDRT
ncbi:hypothetical protein IQ07DRAFT_644970 [Pyrenochaeta sp. DS3sAY3a]|nr:hypothetical protein IQ07DRAFT_644970 [Pyrenochaeta sp. DS3sAY3a]